MRRRINPKLQRSSIRQTGWEGAMRGRSVIIAGAVVALLLAATGAPAAEPQDVPPQDARAAFAHRADTMKRMGRALYTTIGKVVRGKAPLDAQTVEAAETIGSLAATIET